MRRRTQIVRAGPEPTVLHTGDGQPLGNVLAWYLHDEDFQEGQDIRYLTNSRRATLEQPINWVDPPPRDEQPVAPLEMDRCWREGCYSMVPKDDDLGLCPRCVEYLRTL